MELTDRETLIRVETQLQESIRNHAQIRDDLKTIFGKIEAESKVSSQISAELRILQQNSVMKIGELEKTTDVLEENIFEQKEIIKQMQETITLNHEDILDLINTEKQERVAVDNAEGEARKIIEAKAKSSFSTIGVIIAFIAGGVAFLVGIFEIVSFLKNK